MGSDEVLHNGETFTVGVDDRTRDNFTLRVVHQTTHTCDVSNLQPVTTSTRGDHTVNGVISREVLLHRFSYFTRCFSPDLDQFLTTFEVSDHSLFEFGLNLRGQLLVLRNDFALVRRS